MTVGYAVLGSLKYAEYRSHQQATRHDRNGIRNYHLQLSGISPHYNSAAILKILLAFASARVRPSLTG